MAVSNNPVFPQTPTLGLVQVVNADSTGKKTILTAGANGTKVVAIRATSDDTSNRSFGIYVTRGGTDYLIGTVTIPTLAGTDGSAPAIDILGGGTTGQMPGIAIDNDGQRYLLLMNGDVLKAAALVAVTSAKTVNLSAYGADF